MARCELCRVLAIKIARDYPREDSRTTDSIAARSAPVRELINPIPEFTHLHSERDRRRHSRVQSRGKAGRVPGAGSGRPLTLGRPAITAKRKKRATTTRQPLPPSPPAPCRSSGTCIRAFPAHRSLVSRIIDRCRGIEMAGKTDGKRTGQRDQ